MTKTANDNQIQLITSIDFAVAGQALSIDQPHRKHGRCYAEFVGHTGNGRHVLVRKLISSMYRARWTNPIKVERSQVIAVHTNMARAA